jgi:hypothetical protein
MKAYENVEVQPHSFLTSTLPVGDQFDVPTALFPRKEPSVRIEKEAGWFQKRFGCLRKLEFFAATENRNIVTLLVAVYLNSKDIINSAAL